MKYLLILCLSLGLLGCSPMPTRQQMVNESYDKLIDELILSDKNKEKVTVLGSLYLGCLTTLVNDWAIDAGWEMSGGITGSGYYLITLKKVNNKLYLFRKDDGKPSVGGNNENNNP